MPHARCMDLQGPATKKKLAIPAALAIAVIVTGCGNTPGASDAGRVDDGAVADAAFDAGCVDPEVYDPVSHSCVPIV